MENERNAEGGGCPRHPCDPHAIASDDWKFVGDLVGGGVDFARLRWGGGLERTTSYYHLDREAAVHRDEKRQFARRHTLAPSELRLPRDLYERRGIASSDEEEEALREKMVKGAVVLGARVTSLVFGLPKHSSPDVKTIERRVKHIPIPHVTAVDSNTL